MILEFLPQRCTEHVRARRRLRRENPASRCAGAVLPAFRLQIQKLVLSCASNAKTNLGMKKSTLYISEVFADQGAYMKRFQPRAKGSAYKILKPTCSIHVKMRSHETSKRARGPIKLATH